MNDSIKPSTTVKRSYDTEYDAARTNSTAKDDLDNFRFLAEGEPAASKVADPKQEPKSLQRRNYQTRSDPERSFFAQVKEETQERSTYQPESHSHQNRIGRVGQQVSAHTQKRETTPDFWTVSDSQSQY